MARNEEGEFELVLGNKQLLSVFFILVVLLGVFFTMGYIVGRNNPSQEAVNVAILRKPMPPTGSTPKEIDASTPPVAEPKVVDSPKVEMPKPEPVKVDPPKKEEKKAEVKKEEKKAEAKKEEKKEPPKVKDPVPTPPVVAADGSLPKPPAGSYLQVTAIDLKGANIMVDSLRKKSFPALVTEGPRPGNLYRVMVGPLNSAEEVARTRTRLEDIGMKGAMAKKLK